MKFYVTRHGETTWNRENKVCGVTDLELNETGRKQARKTAELLREKEISRILCSPMRRAQETAGIINAGRGLPLLIDVRLREQDYGIFEGAPRDDSGFLSHKRMFATRYPGGESHMLTAGRVYSLLEEARERYAGESLLLVCHGGVCRIIESYFHDMTNEEFFCFSMKNCEVREYEG